MNPLTWAVDLQVGQGDSQLIVFPSGYTVLNDVAELNWNTFVVQLEPLVHRPVWGLTINVRGL